MFLNQFLAAISILHVSITSFQVYARPGKPLPDLLQGNFSADGAVLTLALPEKYFQIWHNRAATSLVCGDFFVNSDQLLGPRAVCRLRGRIVNISLGPDATIQPTLASTSTDLCLPGPTQPLIFKETKPKRQRKLMATSADTGVLCFELMRSVLLTFCNLCDL